MSDDINTCEMYIQQQQNEKFKHFDITQVIQGRYAKDI